MANMVHIGVKTTMFTRGESNTIVKNQANKNPTASWQLFAQV